MKNINRSYFYLWDSSKQIANCKSFLRFHFQRDSKVQKESVQVQLWTWFWLCRAASGGGCLEEWGWTLLDAAEAWLLMIEGVGLCLIGTDFGLNVFKLIQIFLFFFFKALLPTFPAMRWNGEHRFVLIQLISHINTVHLVPQPSKGNKWPPPVWHTPQ